MSLNYFETIIDKFPNLTFSNNFNKIINNYYIMQIHHDNCLLQERYYEIDHNLTQITYYENCKIIYCKKKYESYGSDHYHRIKSRHYTDVYTYDVVYQNDEPQISLVNCSSFVCPCVHFTTKCNTESTWLLSYFFPKIICKSRIQHGMCFSDGNFYYVY